MSDEGIASQEVRNFGFYLSKSENEFYIEDNNIKYDLFRIRYKKFRTKSDEWHLFYQEQQLATISKDKLTQKESDFLYKAEGLQYLLTVIKEEVKAAAATGSSVKLGITKIKTALKKGLK